MCDQRIQGRYYYKLKNISSYNSAILVLERKELKKQRKKPGGKGLRMLMLWDRHPKSGKVEDEGDKLWIILNYIKFSGLVMNGFLGEGRAQIWF